MTRTGENSSSAYLTSIVETLFLSGDEGETLKRHKSFLPFKCLSFLVLWRAENSAHTDGVGFKAWNFWGRGKNEIDRSIRRKVGKMYEKWYKKYQESRKKQVPAACSAKKTMGSGYRQFLLPPFVLLRHSQSATTMRRVNCLPTKTQTLLSF